MAIPVLGIIAATIATSVSADTLPQITIEDISYQGAFALPADSFTLVNPVSSDTNPTSSMNFARGTIDVVGSSLLIVGHDQDQAVTEFQIPSLNQ